MDQTPTTRIATEQDAAAIAEIYNFGIEERVATFETRLRTSEDILKWFTTGSPIVVAEVGGKVAAYVATFPSSDRCCYEGNLEFSVYVHPDFRKLGLATLVLQRLINECRNRGVVKLMSMVNHDNAPSLALMDKVGFRRVGVHKNHGKMDGVWKDTVIIEIVFEENL